MARIAPVVLAVAIWVYGIIHCALTKKDAMPGRVPKWGWMALNVLLPVIGAGIWFVALYFARQEPKEGPEPAGPVAPDDDPEFLAHLERENRFREWERRQNAASEPTQGDAASEDEILRDLEKDLRSGDADPEPPAMA